MTTTSPHPSTRDLPTRRLVAYSAGSLCIGAYSTLPGLVLAYHLTDTLDVAPGLAMLVVLLPRVVGVLLYPVVGALSDRESHRTGRRVRLMTIGALAQPPAFIAMFAAPASLPPPAAAAWVAGFFLLSALAYTLFQVPYVALPAELTRSALRRVSLLGAQVAVLALAILVVGAAGPAVRDLAGGGRTGYTVMATAVSAVMLLGAGWAILGAARRPLLSSDPVGDGITAQYRDGFAALRDTPAYRRLALSFVLQSLATAVMLAGAQYVATFVLGDEAALTWLFVALVAPAILVMPLWTALARRRGKNTAYLASTVLFAASAVSMVGVRWTPEWALYVAVVGAGIAYAGMQAMPTAMLPDAIDLDAAAGGRRRSGAMSALWSGAEALALTLGPAALLLMLSATGFHHSDAGVHAEQPAAALWGIVAGFSVVPAVLVACSAAVLRRLASEHPAW